MRRGSHGGEDLDRCILVRATYKTTWRHKPEDHKMSQARRPQDVTSQKTTRRHKPEDHTASQARKPRSKSYSTYHPKPNKAPCRNGTGPILHGRPIGTNPAVALQSLRDPGCLTYRRFLELFIHMERLLGWVISSSQDLYLHRTTQHRKRRTNIHALSGIRTHDPSNQPAKTHASDRTATVIGIWANRKQN
jgi:hypothetical protein